MNFGSFLKPSVNSDARDILSNNIDKIENIILSAAQIAPDIDWFSFWETDEVYY
jgi:hypothetical protein